MNKRIFQYTAFLIFILFATGSFAQDNRTLDTKVADLLAQMPTDNLDHRDRAMEEILELGPEGFQKIVALLIPAGEGDDTQVRFAINSLARYASDFGMEERRLFVETALLDAIDKKTDSEVLTFLMNQLNLVGGEESVQVLQGYLDDEELAEPATQALLSIGTKSAAEALRSALPGTSEEIKITLVRALGQLNCKSALSEITQLAGTSNTELRKVSLEALSLIGDPDSYKLLLSTAKDVDFNYDPTHAAENFLNYADRLGEKNNTDLCKKALKAVFKANTEQDKLHNYSKALYIYANHFGYETMPLLLEAVDNSNKAFRYSALNIAENLGGIAATRKWVEKAKSANPTVKAEIISMLGRKGDAFAVEFIKSNLNSPVTAVREEAINALVALQNREATPVLLAHLVTGNDMEATKTALLQLLNKQHLAPVAEQLDNTRGETKALLVELIGMKAGSQFFSTVYDLTNADDAAVREAAFAALEGVSTESHIEELIDKLLSVQNEKEIKYVQDAIVKAAEDVKVEKTKNGQVLTALEKTEKKERIIAILPEIGGVTALNTVESYFENSSGSTKETAFEALTNWKDYSAASSLYKICETASEDYRKPAFANFIRQVRIAQLPDDQKLLQYRKIMPFAKTSAEKIRVIESIGQLKTFLSIVYLEDFLDIDELQQTTARAIMSIALPDSNGENGFTGKKVKDLLTRIASLLKGEDSEYDIINIRNYLEEMPDDEGFVSMFNGKNLDGWQGLVENPVTRAKMSEKELARAQKKANNEMHENWAVKDNTIVFNGEGANLCSEKEYGDFELIVDWKITKKGDSGIYLRGTPQVQIWDISRTDVGAQVGSGGLYNNKNHESKPLVVADNPIGAWNTFHITMIGENVTVYLNGKLVVDNVPMENYWDKSQPIFPTGPIELQAHGTDIAFRDIYVKEINTAEIGLTEEEVNDGFVSLFNGKNLDGWQGNKTDYVAQDGELLVQPKNNGHGNLYTGKEYSDFIFRFEFQLTPGANNGLGIRAPLEGDAAYVGTELQILDNTAPIYANLKKYQYHGSAYGIIPAKRGFLNPVGDWNYQEVVLKGSHLKITLNGTVILDGDLKEASKNGTMDGRDHPGLKRDKGYIGFLGHGSELKFRNIRIKDLSE